MQFRLFDCLLLLAATPALWSAAGPLRVESVNSANDVLRRLLRVDGLLRESSHNARG